MNVMRLTLSLTIAGLVTLAPRPAGAETLAPEQVEFFETKIRPILADHCYACHSGSAKEIKAAFRLDFRDGLLKGGESGKPAIVAGNPDGSPLIRAVKRLDPKTAMPPKAEKALTAEQVALLEHWVQMGAPDPRPAGPTALTDPAVKAKSHWAFKKPVEPAMPVVTHSEWATSDLDRFILAKLEEKQLAPAAQADKVT